MSGWNAIAGLAKTISGGLLDKEMRKRDDETWSKRQAEQEAAIAAREEADARRAERLAKIQNEGDLAKSWLAERGDKKAREAQDAIERLKEEGRDRREKFKQDSANKRTERLVNRPASQPASRSDMWKNQKTGEVRYFGPSNQPPAGTDWQPFHNPTGKPSSAKEFDPDAFLTEIEGG